MAKLSYMNCNSKTSAMLKNDVTKSVLTKNYINCNREDGVNFTKAKFQISENPIINNNDVEEPPISLQCNQILTIFHQNICGLQTKTNEIVGYLSSDLPYILCFTELN
jgi:hypothetical protein